MINWQITSFLLCRNEPWPWCIPRFAGGRRDASSDPRWVNHQISLSIGKCVAQNPAGRFARKASVSGRRVWNSWSKFFPNPHHINKKYWRSGYPPTKLFRIPHPLSKKFWCGGGGVPSTKIFAESAYPAPIVFQLTGGQPMKNFPKKFPHTSEHPCPAILRTCRSGQACFRAGWHMAAPSENVPS